MRNLVRLPPNDVSRLTLRMVPTKKFTHSFRKSSFIKLILCNNKRILFETVSEFCSSRNFLVLHYFLKILYDEQYGMVWYGKLLFSFSLYNKLSASKQ